MKENEIKKGQGLCAKCGSEEIIYGVSEFDDDGVIYDYDCEDCGHSGTEFYDLVFTTSE